MSSIVLDAEVFTEPSLHKSNYVFEVAEFNPKEKRQQKQKAAMSYKL